jgi:hypothetical protein
MVFKVKLGYLCSIYNILCFFRGGGAKLKQNLEGGARCKRLGTSVLGDIMYERNRENHTMRKFITL